MTKDHAAFDMPADTVHNVSFLWQRKIFECCIMIMPEVEGAILTLGTRVRNKEV